MRNYEGNKRPIVRMDEFKYWTTTNNFRKAIFPHSFIHTNMKATHIIISDEEFFISIFCVLEDLCGNESTKAQRYKKAV